MKKSTILCILATIVAFYAGFCVNQIMHSNDTNLIYTQKATIEQGNRVMWNNDLFDADGSDDMNTYLELCQDADSLYEANF